MTAQGPSDQFFAVRNVRNELRLCFRLRFDEGAAGMSDKEERIRQRAYQLWVEEGQPEGRHDHHWATALRLIEEEDGAAPPARARRGAAASNGKAAPAATRGTAKPASSDTKSEAKAGDGKPAKKASAKPEVGATTAGAKAGKASSPDGAGKSAGKSKSAVAGAEAAPSKPRTRRTTTAGSS